MRFTTPVEKKAEALRKSMPPYVRKQAFKAASLIYDRAGLGDKPLAFAFRKMASADPGPDANPIACAIHAALGKDVHDKSANRLIGLASALVPGTVSTAADAIKILAGTGLVAGGVLGAGAFGTGRLLDSNNEKLLKLEQERNIMRRMTGDIERELKLRNLQPTPENRAAAVDYLT